MGDINSSSSNNFLSPCSLRPYTLTSLDTVRETSKPKQLLADSVNHFASSLLCKLLDNKKLSSNILFSPLSSHVALSMLLNAADGKTKDQLLTGLGLDSFAKDAVKHVNSGYQDALNKLSSTKNFELEVANRAFVAKKTSDKLDKVLYSTFGAKPAVVKFKAEPEETRKMINKFVADKTHGKIENLIAKGILSPSTAFVIISALYFRGNILLLQIIFLIVLYDVNCMLMEGVLNIQRRSLWGIDLPLSAPKYA